MAPFWYWCLSLQMEYFGTLRFSKMQITFLSFWWYHLILCHFFQILLILLSCKDDFGYLGQMLACFTLVGDLERFFRMCYRIFPWVTTRLTTHVTISLWGFCTVSNTLLLLAHYYIGHCMPYYTFSVK